MSNQDPTTQCEFEGCNRPNDCRGLCDGHMCQIRKGRSLTPLEKTDDWLSWRFWRKVLKGPGCWEWQGAKVVAGYGALGFRGVQRKTHRLSWEIHNGPIPDGLWVLHHCDNRGCVNPAHLYAGTPTDNNRDTIKRHRGNRGRGESAGASKYTRAQALAITTMLETGAHSMPSIATAVGVGWGTVQSVWAGKAWAHIPRPWLSTAPKHYKDYRKSKGFTSP